MVAGMTSLHELYPQGRRLYYEGDHPEAFFTMLRERYGFDPQPSCTFTVPAKHLAAFDAASYPVGS